jgi:hypothetical protein
MRPCWCCAVVGLAATVSLSAGEPSQQPGAAAAGAQTTGRAGQPGGGKPISIDGCIQTAPAGQVSSGVKYVLASRSGVRGAGANAGGRGRGGAATDAAATTNARGAATPTGADGDEPGTGRGAGAGPGGGTLVRYPLDGDEKAIAPHLNHVVEVAGTLQGTPPPPPTGAANPGAATIGQTLKVESVKMVAAVCP